MYQLIFKLLTYFVMEPLFLHWHISQEDKPEEFESIVILVPQQPFEQPREACWKVMRGTYDAGFNLFYDVNYQDLPLQPTHWAYLRD